MPQEPLPFRPSHADNYIENSKGGIVNIKVEKPMGRPPKPPEETKETTSFRIEPKKRAAFERAIHAERSNMTEFLTKCGEFGVEYSYDEMKFMLDHSDVLRSLFKNWEVIVPILVKLP